MNLNFDNLTSEMAPELLNDKELMVEFCSLIKGLNNRVKELERSNGKLVRFAMLQSHYNKEAKRKPINVQQKRKMSIAPRKKVQSRESFGDFRWDKKGSFGSF